MGIFRPFNPFCTGVKEFHSFPVHSKLHFALTQEFTRASQRSNSTRSSGTHRAPWRMQRISVACGRQLHSIASIFNGSKRKSQRAAEKRSREHESERRGRRRAHFAGWSGSSFDTFSFSFPSFGSDTASRRLFFRSVIVGLCLLVRVFAASGSRN